MNLKETLKEIYTKYDISKRKFHISSSTPIQNMEGLEVNRNRNFKAFRIKNNITKNDECRFEDGYIEGNSIRIRASYCIFINISFISCRFSQCSFKNAYFINCLFDDVDFKASGMHNTIFSDCSFENCRMNDLTASDLIFVNSNPEEIIDIEAETSLTDILQETEVFHDDRLLDFLNTDKNNDLATLPSKEKTNEMEKTKMDSIIKKQTLENYNFDDENKTQFEECIIVNSHIISKRLDNYLFIKCKFVNCKFTATQCLNNIFDNSRFESCEFELTLFSRCSLEEVLFDENCKLGVQFNSCHTFNTILLCDTSLASFSKTSISQFSTEENSKKESDYESVITELSKVLDIMKSEDFKKSIENKKKIIEEDIYAYFSKLTLDETIKMISKITASCTKNNSNENIKPSSLM